MSKRTLIANLLNRPEAGGNYTDQRNSPVPAAAGQNCNYQL